MDDMQSKIEQMRSLIATIKQADTAYFRDDRPIMSDRDYDVAVDLLKNLEKTTGVVLSDSPHPKGAGRGSGEPDESAPHPAHAVGR